MSAKEPLCEDGLAGKSCGNEVRRSEGSSIDCDLSSKGRGTVGAGTTYDVLLGDSCSALLAWSEESVPDWIGLKKVIEWRCPINNHPLLAMLLHSHAIQERSEL